MDDPRTRSAEAHKQLQEAKRLFTEGMKVLVTVSSSDLASIFAREQRSSMILMLESMMSHANGRGCEALMWIANIALHTEPTHSEPENYDD